VAPCPLDSPDDLHGDGVCDQVDVCPLDALDDVTGDTDGDGVCDDLDVCPADGADGTCVGDDATGCRCSPTGGARSPWNMALFGVLLLGVWRRERSHRG